MRNSYGRQNNVKIVVYAVLLALAVGMGAIVVQDIKVPVEHVSQQVKLNIEK